MPDFYDDAIEPVYLIETVLGGLVIGRAISGINAAVNFWKTGQRIHKNPRSEEIINSIEKYLGGKPDRVFRNKKDDIVIMKDNKKIRFDINGKKFDKEHFHIQEEISPGEWKDVVKHRHYFKD